MKIKKINNQPASIEDALKNPHEVISILINFDEEGILDAQIAEFRNLKYLTLLECHKEMELPVLPHTYQK